MKYISDEDKMRVALDEARKALDMNEVPVGAAIFDKDDSVVYLDYPGYENYGKERKREILDSVRSRKKADEGYGRQAELTSL